MRSGAIWGDEVNGTMTFSNSIDCLDMSGTWNYAMSTLILLACLGFEISCRGCSCLVRVEKMITRQRRTMIRRRKTIR